MVSHFVRSYIIFLVMMSSIQKKSANQMLGKTSITQSKLHCKFLSSFYIFIFSLLADKTLFFSLLADKTLFFNVFPNSTVNSAFPLFDVC